MAEAEQQRVPAAICRQRRVEAYAEARPRGHGGGQSPGALGLDDDYLGDLG